MNDDRVNETCADVPHDAEGRTILDPTTGCVESARGCETVAVNPAMAKTTPAPTAAQTVKQAAAEYGARFNDRSAPWAEHHFEAGAAWMRERVANPDDATVHAMCLAFNGVIATRDDMTKRMRAALTALCASDAEKEKPG